MRNCWHCDQCGHEWMARGEKPKQCAKCRKRDWDSKGDEMPSRAAERYARIETIRIANDRDPDQLARLQKLNAGKYGGKK